MRVLLLLLFLLVQEIATAQDHPDPIFFFERDTKFVPYRQQNKWGIMTQEKKWVMQPKHKFDSVGLFHFAVAIFKVGDKYGFIDTTGKVIAKPVYSSIQFNTENQYYELKRAGKASNYLLNDKKVYKEIPAGHERIEIGFLAEEYEIQIPPQEYFVKYQTANGKWGMHLETFDDKVIPSEREIPAIYSHLDPSGNYYLATLNGKMGMVAEGNNVIIPFDNWYIGRTHFYSFYPVSKNGKWGLLNIDNDPQLVVPIEYDDIIISSSSECYGFRLIKDKKMGYFSIYPEKLIAPSYTFIRGFVDAAPSQVITSTGKIGYVGLDGYEYFKD